VVHIVPAFAQTEIEDVDVVDLADFFVMVAQF
jgi:hypothetical protein